MKNKFFSFVFVLFFLVIVSGVFFIYLILPVDKSEKATYYTLKVPQGATVKHCAFKLKNEKIIKSAYAMFLLAKMQKPLVKSGRYNLNSSMSIPEILAALKSGKQESVSISIPEGMTFSKIAKLLEDNEITSCSAFEENCKNPAVLEKYNIPSESLEGYLFPDTYFFDYEMDSLDVIDIMVKNFQKKIAAIPELQKLTPQELHQKVILASIVEREYRVEKEAPLIASVFSNRIRRGIGLYSCATIEYIITEIEKKPHPEKITYADTRIDSPYNTYKWAGLPPGAISNPGLISLKAAANPPRTKYYFFKLIDAKKGIHHFSEDLDEHSETPLARPVKKVAGE
jgi:UPF0755 protein